jgi:phage terminase Nu1 subunit (DNA packaging protein)
MAGVGDPTGGPTSVKIQDQLASPGDLCDWLGISLKSFESLATARVPVQVARGRYLLKASIQAIHKRALQAAAGREGGTVKARTSLLESQARLARLKEARLRGDLVDRREVIEQGSAIIRDSKAKVLAVPSRVAALLPHLTMADVSIIDAELRAALQELSETSFYEGAGPAPPALPAPAPEADEGDGEGES